MRKAEGGWRWRRRRGWAAPGLQAVAAMAALLALRVGLAAQTKNPADLGLGKVLVATREIGDPHFAETVILLVHFDDTGAVGLVLNKPSKIPISQALPSMNEAQRRSDNIFVGGPVEPTLIFGLLRSKNAGKDAAPVLPDVFLVVNKGILQDTFKKADPKDFRIFMGYAGWSNAQVNREVSSGEWYIFPSDATLVFDANTDLLWESLIAKAEPKGGRIAGAAGLRMGRAAVH